MWLCIERAQPGSLASELDLLNSVRWPPQALFPSWVFPLA